VTVRAGKAYRKIWRLVNNFFCSHNKVHCSEIPIGRWIGEWTDRVLHFASELKWSRKMWLLSISYFSFEISIACRLLSRPNWRIVCKLTTYVVTYCTEASSQKSKYAYRKIFFKKKALVLTICIAAIRLLMLTLVEYVESPSDYWCNRNLSVKKFPDPGHPKIWWLIIPKLSIQL